MLKPNKKKFIMNDDLEILKFLIAIDLILLTSLMIKKEFVSLWDVLNNFQILKQNTYLYWILLITNFKYFGLQTRINTDSILSIWGE